MKTCHDTEQLILLEQSGELDDASALYAHLDTCDACRDFQASLTRVVGMASTALPSADASDAVVANILHSAGKKRHRPVIQGPWKQMIALAACMAFMAVIATNMMTPPASTQGEGMETTAADIRALIQVYDDDAAENAMLENGTTVTSGEDAIQALATELLEMQGFGLEMDDELMLSSI